MKSSFLTGSSFYPATAHKSIIKYLLLGLISGVLVLGGVFFAVTAFALPPGCTGSCTFDWAGFDHGSMSPSGGESGVSSTPTFTFTYPTTLQYGCTMSPNTPPCSDFACFIYDDFNLYVYEDPPYDGLPGDEYKIGQADVYAVGNEVLFAEITWNPPYGSGLPDGHYYWKVRRASSTPTEGCSGSGYEEGWEDFWVGAIPNQPPTANFTGSPTSGSPPLTVSFSNTSSDPEGGALTYSWTFGDGGTSTIQNPSHTYTSASTYTVKLTVTDIGGAQDTLTRTNYITLGDFIPPTGSIFVNGGSTYASSTDVPLTLNCSDADSPPCTKMKFSNNDSSWSAEENYAQSKLSWTLIAGDGVKTVYVRYKDSAGNWMTSSVSDTIILETIEPDTILTTYSPDPTNDNTPTYSGTASDSTSDVHEIRYRIDLDSDWITVDPITPSANVSFTFTTSILSDGFHTIYARARDGAGNWETTLASDTLVISTIPSGPTNLSAAPICVGSGNADVNLSWTDNATNENGFYVYRSTIAGFTPGDGYKLATIAVPNTQTYTDATPSVSTTYYYRVNAYNASGPSSYSNQATGATSACNSAPTAPAFITYTAPATAYTNSTLTCEASGSTDPDGDPLTYYYQFKDTDNSTVLQNWSTTNTFPCTTANCNKGDTIYCHAKANDGTADGPEGTPATKAISNSAPVLAAIGDRTKNENELLTFTISATDADGGSLTYSASNLPNGATFTPATKTFSWTPTYAQAGTYPNVKFIVSDGSITDDELITITVNNVNRAPVWSPVIPDTTAQENVLKTYNVSGYASDPDGDSLTFSKFAGPAALTVSPAGIVSWTPSYTDGGNHNVEVRASDGSLIAYDTFQITVSDVNLAPILEPIGPQTINEGATLTFTVYATDEEGSQANLTISEIGNGDFTAATVWDGVNKWKRTYTWTPTYLQAGNHNVTFTATDRQGATDSEIVVITVNNVNHTPLIAAINNITKIEGDIVSFSVVITDQYDTDDTETVSYTISQAPKGGSVINFVAGNYTASSGQCSIASGNLVCTIPFSWPTNYYDAGVYDLTFNVHDNYGAVDPDGEFVRITVDNNNRTNLTIALSGNEPINVNEQTEITFTVIATDTDKDDTINFTISNKPTGALYPIDNQGQTTQISFKLSDDECLINGQDKLECTVSFKWTPGWYDDTNPYDGLPAGVPTTYTPNFAVNDGLGGSASASKTIEVSDNNRELSCSKLTNIKIGGVSQAERPLACEQSTSFTIDENQSLVITFSVLEPDTDNILSYWRVGTPVCDAATPQDECLTVNNFSWTPTYDQAGNYSFQFWATDAITSSNYVTVNITVNDVNRSPYFNPQPSNFTAIEGTEKIYTVKAYDDDGDVLTYTYSFTVNPPGGDTAVIPKINNNQADFKWAPAYVDGGYPNQSKNYTLTFKAEDDGSTLPKKNVSKSVTVTVYDKNRQPAMDNIPNKQVLENQLLQFTVVTADADSDNVLTHTITTPDADHPGAVIDNPTKKISFTPAYDFITNLEDVPLEDTLMTIKVDDGSYQPQTISGGGASNISKSTTITVLDVNRAPQYVDAVVSKTVEEGLTLTFNIEVSDVDGDAIPIDYSWMLIRHDDDPLNDTPLPVGKPGADDDIKYPVSAVPSGGYPNKTTLAFSWTPSEDQGGANPATCEIVYPLRVYAKDDIKNRARTTPLPVNEPITITKDIAITVYNKNQAPIITDPSDGSVEENQNFNLNIQATDPDPADQLTYSIVSVDPPYIEPMVYPNDYATINPNNGAFSWKPNYVQAGTVDRNPPNREYWTEYTFTVKVEDNFDCPGGKKSDTASFKIKVTDDNRAPDLSDDATAIPPCDADICIIEGASSQNSFSINNLDPDTDNTFKYKYNSNPPLLSVVDTSKGINFGGQLLEPGVFLTTTNKTPQFVWTPTYNQAYYNAAGTALQPYTFTFTVDDQRAAPNSDSHNVVIKIIDLNQAPVFEMVASPLIVSENGTLDIVIKARDNDWDYVNMRGDKIQFSLVGYSLVAQELPADDLSISNAPVPAKLWIDGNYIFYPIVQQLAIPPTAPGNEVPIDLETGIEDCQIYAGPPAYTECQQTLKVDLIMMYHTMGWHTFTFAATDDRHGDDDDYLEDDPKTSTYPLLVQVSNVNRAPAAPTPVFPDNDSTCAGVLPPVPYAPASGCIDHDLNDEPRYNPANLVFEFTPGGDPDNWAHEDKIDYILYIKKIGPTEQDINFTRRDDVKILDLDADDVDCIVKQGTTNCKITLTDLEPRTDYEWYIRAEDDAPDGILTTDSLHFRFRTGIRQCFGSNGGIECRKGEICVDVDNDGDTLPDSCLNSNECNPEGVSCYLSACDINKMPPDPSCATASSSNRVFHESQGKCSAIIGNRCDLPAAKANTPEACNVAPVPVVPICYDNSAPILANVSIAPDFKWIDSDPSEIWSDYKGDPIGYLGTQTRYKFYIDNDKETDAFDYFHPPDNPPFDWNLADLAYRPQNQVNRSFSFINMTGEYLNFNEAYKWKVEAYTNDDNDPVMGPEWQFNTMSVCDILEYAYLFDGQSFTYNPDNNQTAPDGPLPVGVELRWPPEDYYLVNDILKGPGAGDQALYDLRLQECDLSGLNCQPIMPNIDTSGNWGYVAKNITDSSYSFDNVVPPLESLNYKKKYIWQAVVHHGRFGADITTECPIDGNFFITPEPPGVNLTKSIAAVSESQITYQIDFTVTGEPWQRITDFYIRDNFPNFTDEAFNYTFLGDIDGAYGDDKLIRRDPTTLYIGSHSAEDYEVNSYIKWYIKDSNNKVDDCAGGAEGCVKVDSSGSLKITLDQNPDIAGHIEAGECIWLINQVYGGGIDERGVDFNTGELPVYSPPYLAGTENIDYSFLSSQQGNIHSNVNICLQNAPPTALNIYTSDYFITAGGEENVPEAWLRKGEDYRKTDFFLEEVTDVDIQYSAPNVVITITKTNSREVIELYVDEYVAGDSDVAGLFGSSIVDGELNLDGKVFLCKDCDLVIDKKLIINNQGGYGTVIVDGNLTIEDDIYYSDNAAVSDLSQLASLGWIVLGDVKMREYYIDNADDCAALPESEWCADYNLVIDPDGAGPLSPELAYGPITVGPVHIVGVFLVIGKGDPYVGGDFYTGKIHLPLEVEGSIIANKVVLQRQEFPD